MPPRIIFLASLTALAACGGSGDSDLGGPTDNPEVNALLAEGESLVDKADGLLLSDRLPPRNDVAFNGVFVATDDIINPTEAYIGDFVATVDFNDGNMHGDIDRIFFFESDDAGDPASEPVLVAGAIDLDSTTVDVGLFDVAFSGNLTIDGGLRTISAGDGFGAFFGEDADMFDAAAILGFTGTTATLDAAVIAD